MCDPHTCIRAFDHAPSFREYCEDAGLCPICGDDIFDCRCPADMDLEGEARAFEARRDDDAIDYAMGVHFEPAPEPVKATGWKPTSDPQLSWRWARTRGGLVVESRRGKLTTRCSPAAVNEAAQWGNRDAVVVQRAIGGAR